MLNDSSDKSSTPTANINKGTATFADNVLTLTGGATIALVVTILASPITSRIFGPQEFGLAALFRSGAIMLTAIACLRYEMAIVLPKKKEDAATLFNLCCMVLLAMTILVAFLTTVFGTRVLLYLNAVDLKPILWLFPAAMFLMGSQLPLKHWFTRKKKFKINAAGDILISIPITMAEITGGWTGFRTGENLVVLRCFGLIFSPAFYVWRLLRSDARYIITNLNYGRIIEQAKRYMKFPLLDSWSTLLIQLSVNAPILLLTSFFSPQVSGFYAKAFYLLHLPSILVGRSVGQVFLQKSAAAIAGGKNLAGLVEAVFNRMITLGTFPFTILVIIGPELFDIILGARWKEAGIYAQIMMPQLFVAFLLGSIMTLFGTLGKQELNLISSALNLILRIATLIGGGLLLRDARMTIFIFMVANVAMGLWRISLLLRATKLSAAIPLAHFTRCMVYVLPSIGSIAAMKWWFGLEPIYLVALSPIFSIPYIALVLRQDLELRNLSSIYLRRLLSLR